jgi:small subunit ribosomal protein S17
MKTKSTGTKAGKAKEDCKDQNCPIHGSLKCRGKTFVCTVISTKMQKTVTVSWDRRIFLGKYERYEKRRSKIKAHNPDCIDAHEGEVVKIMECRPLSKTKSFVIIEVLGKEKGFKEKMESKEEGKFKEKSKKEEKVVEDSPSKDQPNEVN